MIKFIKDCGEGTGFAAHKKGDEAELGEKVESALIKAGIAVAANAAVIVKTDKVDKNVKIKKEKRNGR